ncbi:MAG: hypothetical protein WCA19_12940 [Candidatus Acidiferrales bacterium]
MVQQTGRKALRDLARNVHHETGDALAGEKIIAEARDISTPIRAHGTSKHQIQEIVLRRNAFCVIDRAFSAVETALTLKKS